VGLPGYLCNNVRTCLSQRRQYSLTDFKSEQLAEQMTLLDAELFQRIEIPEILLWVQEQNEDKSPNLTRFTEHFNKMSYWYVLMMSAHFVTNSEPHFSCQLCSPLLGDFRSKQTTMLQSNMCGGYHFISFFIYLFFKDRRKLHVEQFYSHLQFELK
jgi:hypothetical protein